MDRSGFISMLRGAAGQIRAEHELLSKLDSCGGDGDHGTTMLRAMTGMEKVLDTSTATQVQGLLQEVGWGIMGVDGGSTGPLFGTFFLGMAGPVAGHTDIDGATLAAMFEAGLAGVRKQTKAQSGDKTMLDALIPAVEAARRAADAGADVCGVLNQAAEAAKLGAEATSQWPAKFGRARNVGTKSVGTQDPGATSVSLMFRGFLQSTNHA